MNKKNYHDLTVGYTSREPGTAIMIYEQGTSTCESYCLMEIPSMYVKLGYWMQLIIVCILILTALSWIKILPCSVSLYHNFLYSFKCVHV
jgi:hypothetical protein